MRFTLHALAFIALSLLVADNAGAQDTTTNAPRAVAAAEVGLDLDACVAYARSNALGIAQQRLRSDNARLATRIAWQKFAPALDGSVGHQSLDETTQGRFAITQTLPADFKLVTGVQSEGLTAEGEGGIDLTSENRYSILLSKRILGGGSYAESMLEIDNSTLDEVIAVNAYALAERDLTLRVILQYYQLQRARQTLAIRQRRLEVSRTNVEHALAREEPLDIANAQLEVPVSEAAVLRSRREIETALDALKQEIGWPLDQSLEVSTRYAFKPQQVHVETDVLHAAASHEEILNQKLAVRKLENELPVRKARVYPAVDVSTAARQMGGDATDDWAYDTRVTASWTLFAGAERARVRQLQNQAADARLTLEILLREQAIRLRNLGRRLEEALLQVDIGHQSLTVATRRAALYRDRWENGAIDILEYIRSQNDMEERRVDVVDLEIAYMETLADYRNAAGLNVAEVAP